jgi:hypothetical protein
MAKLRARPDPVLETVMPRFSLCGLATPVLALAAFAFAFDVDAQTVAGDEPVVDLVGQVVDGGTGRAVVGAAVSVSETERFDITDDEGRFALSVPLGSVTLVVEQIGYAELRKSVTADAESGPIRLELAPRPVVLEGLHVMIDRLAARRLATAMSVQTLGADELVHAGSDLFEALRYGSGMMVVRCPTEAEIADGCVYRHGSTTRPSVYIDEVPAEGGLYELAVYSPAEVYAVEVYGTGAQVRVYTRLFMDKIARSPRALRRAGG